MKILIVGGVAGGAGAAARLRRINEQDEIIMFEKTPYISYANCGLPYYLSGVIKDREKLLVETVEGMSKKFNLDVRVNSEVIAIDKVNKTVEVHDLKANKKYTESYDKLILSTGANAIMPKIENLKTVPNVFTLKNIPDTDRVYNYLKDNTVKNAIVVGAGFIGVEVAENLIERGLNVTLIDSMKQIISGPSDFEMAQYLHQELVINGINLILEDLVTKISEDGKTVFTKGGLTIDTDIIIMAVGITPATELAQGAGLTLNSRTKAILVDDEFKTSEADIYAVGDAIMQKDMFGEDSLVPLAWGANRQARQLADSINGRKISKDIIRGANAIKVFNKTFASVGITEKVAKLKKLNYEVIYISRGNHAGYYPNSSPIVMKMIFDKKTAQIYGVQAVGNEGVEKRIDIISTAMKFNAKATDLSSIEICYAPPFNSAKDPVNILGYVAENLLENVYKNAQYYEIDDIVANGGYLLDVRTPIEYELGNIQGSHLIELDNLRDNTDKLPEDKTKPIYLTCQIGHRGYFAIQILRNLGYNNLYNLTGGYSLYKMAKYEITKSNKPISRAKENIEMKNSVNIEVDCSGMQCPGPIMQTKKNIDNMTTGDTLKIISTDCGYMRDIESWCNKTGNTLVSLGNNKNGAVEAIIAKGDKSPEICQSSCQEKATTMVVFSGDLDKVLASMIIANGSVALGHKVTMFFTFWGLNALRKDKKVKVKKGALDKMFGAMMPRGTEKLKLSNMNMMGMGTKMMKYTMKKKNVDSLNTLMKQAMENGVEMVACTMSMDVMGIQAEELIEGISLGGVATYVSEAQESQNTLFI